VGIADVVVVAAAAAAAVEELETQAGRPEDESGY
jgi:hypothetical protein